MSEIRLGAGEGRLLAEIHRLGEVIEQRTDGADLVLKARVDDALAGRLRRAGARVENGAPTNGGSARGDGSRDGDGTGAGRPAADRLVDLS